MQNKEIAHALNIAVVTVNCHVSIILQKLNVVSRTQAAMALYKLTDSDWHAPHVAQINS